MFEPKEMWPVVYGRRPEYTKDSQPRTARLDVPLIPFFIGLRTQRRVCAPSLVRIDAIKQCQA